MMQSNALKHEPFLECKFQLKTKETKYQCWKRDPFFPGLLFETNRTHRRILMKMLTSSIRDCILKTRAADAFNFHDIKNLIM